MGKNSVENYQALYDYIRSVSLRETDILRRLREETATATAPWSKMQISPDQGQFMALLLKLIGAKKVLEIGAFTGYSTLCFALALPKEGKVITCDVNDKWTNIARKYWKEAGVAEKIDLKIRSAAETLDELILSKKEGLFDFVFIDADKSNYDIYYEKSLRLLHADGLIIVDNVFWGGRVVDPEADDEDTDSIRNLNKKIHSDERVEISMLSIGDGIFMAKKRADQAL